MPIEVVVDDQRDVDVAPHRSQQVVASFAVVASVARVDDDGQVAIRDLCRLSYRQGAPMQAVEDVDALEIERQFGCLADSGDVQEVVSRDIACLLYTSDAADDEDS